MKEDLYPSRRGHESCVIGRKDPVIYSQWSPNAPLSKDQTVFYQKNGFIVLENSFDRSEIELIQNEAAEMRSGSYELEDGTTIVEPGSRTIRSIFALHRQSSIFERLTSDSRIIDIVEFILGEEVYIFQSRLNYKSGFKGKEFFWHSDFETWHVEDGMPDMRAVSVSLLLTENVAINGPTMFIKGSHLEYISCPDETPKDHYKQSLQRQEYGVPDIEHLSRLARKGIAMPEAQAGAIVIFDCNTMHGSNSNISPLPRSNAFFVYNAISNKTNTPYGPTEPRPEFLAARQNIEPIKPVRGHLLSSRSGVYGE